MSHSVVRSSSYRLGLAAMAVVAAVPAGAQQAPRSVVPIRETVIRPIGTPRYSVTLTINGTAVETGLDTGSIGLRLLPRAVRQARIPAEGAASHYSYGSGVTLDGHRAAATVQIGEVRGSVPVQAVDRVGCVAEKDCPAAHLSAEDYGLMGSGQPGQGFDAIMGTRLNTGDIPNTLVALGVRRWIVHLPQRGGGGGVLILNPDARDVAGFLPLRTGVGVPGTVGACAMIARPGAQRFCGPTLLDTGAPGLAVHGAERPAGWQPGLPARIAFYTAAGGEGPAVAFRTGDRADGAETRFVASTGRGLSLSAGTLPFYAYDVLYDGEAGTIAVRPNGAAGDVRAVLP